MQDSTMLAHHSGLAHSLMPLPGHDISAGTIGAGLFPPYNPLYADPWSHHRDAPMSDMHARQAAPATATSAEANDSQQRGASGASSRASMSHRTSSSNATSTSATTVNHVSPVSPRRRSSGSVPGVGSSFSSAGAPNPKAGQKRKGRTREPAAKVKGGDGTPKRSKFLERNRLAASKCREKKKVWLHELEETKEELESRHRGLRMEYESLLNEVTSMKNSLVSHACCSDPKIDSWIKNEARRFVKRAAERPPSPCLSICSTAQPSRDGFGSHHSNSPAFETSETYKRQSINLDHMPDDLSD